MPVSLAYPKDLFHPCGSKTVTVYDSDEEKAAHGSFQEWREGEREATLAAREGRAVKIAAPPEPPPLPKPARATKQLDQESN